MPFLLETLDAAKAAFEGAPAPNSAEARIAAIYGAHQAAFEEVRTRVLAWQEADFPTPSGVDTFYNTVGSGDLENAVATTIFAHWFPRFVRGVLDDEKIPGRLSPAATGDTFRTQTILMWVRGRGDDNPEDLASWHPTRKESVFFDDQTTSEIETSTEIAIKALAQSIDFLSGPPVKDGEGGFGTTDMSQWLWGLRHQVRFESLVARELGDPLVGALLGDFNVDTGHLPLAENLAADDPRAGLRWFPRPGDQFDIDAANPGLGGERFTHGAGPVFRMVIALGPDGVRGQNIIPGGQNGVPFTEHFADQTRLWLANDTVPMRYTPEEVAAGAIKRERFTASAP